METRNPWRTWRDGSRNLLDSTNLERRVFIFFSRSDLAGSGVARSTLVYQALPRRLEVLVKLDAKVFQLADDFSCACSTFGVGKQTWNLLCPGLSEKYILNV